jgi:ABC exporter DevB family membrane fusion protein
LLILTVAVAAWAVWAGRGAAPYPKAGAPAALVHDRTAVGEVAVSCTGRVEGASETTEVGAGVDGVVAELKVREGDHVKAGDVVAVIDRRELKPELSAAQAAADAARQGRIRILRGSRREDRERADAEVAAAEAVVAQAELQHRRSARLFEQGILSEAESDEVRRNLDVSQARLRAARKAAELVKAPPLPEEAAKAEADVRAAEQRVRAAVQTLEKCLVRAPISGTVLRTMLKAGESFSTLVPRPILSLADTSRLRVRAEVDERDVSRVFPGQRVLVRGEGWEGPGVPGRVDRLGAQMGRKTVKTGDPAEKSDRDVLEVLVDLDREEPRLVLGLRVTALFLKGKGSSPSPAGVAP